MTPLNRTCQSLCLIAVFSFTGCGADSGTSGNSLNAFISDRYSQCQLGTSTEDLATPDPDRFQARSIEGKRMTMQYRLFIPDGYDPAIAYPLVIYLHGGAGNGTDNLRQITTNANLVVTHLFSSPAVQSTYPCLVVAPQIPGTDTQDLDNWWATITQHGLSDNLFTAMEILDELEAEFTIDRKRIYAVGNSLGGAGVWDLASKTSGRFAAFIPTASPPQWAGIRAPSSLRPDFARTIRDKTFWFLYGDQDGNGQMKPWWDEVVGLLRDDGLDPLYTEYVGGQHSIFRCAYTEPNLIPWLFSQVLPK
jgi:predicted peptidase